MGDRVRRLMCAVGNSFCWDSFEYPHRPGVRHFESIYMYIYDVTFQPHARFFAFDNLFLCLFTSHSYTTCLAISFFPAVSMPHEEDTRRSNDAHQSHKRHGDPARDTRERRTPARSADRRGDHERQKAHNHREKRDTHTSDDAYNSRGVQAKKERRAGEERRDAPPSRHSHDKPSSHHRSSTLRVPNDHYKKAGGGDGAGKSPRHAPQSPGTGGLLGDVVGGVKVLIKDGVQMSVSYLYL